MDNPNFEPPVVVADEHKAVVEEDTHPSNIRISFAPINDNQQQHIDAEMKSATNTTPPASISAPLATLGNEPVSALIKSILHDPATLKLLTIIISSLSLCLVSPNANGDYQAVPSFVISGFSLIYSIFAIIITVVYKSEENVEKCGVFQKLFVGRYVYWHEFHSTMTFMFAVANLSCIVFILSDPLLNVLLSLANTFAFGYEFVTTTKKAKLLFVTEKSVPNCDCKFTKCFLGLFQRHPIRFNVLQTVSLIATFILYLSYVYNTRLYFCYCTGVAAIGSSFPLLLRLSKRDVVQLSISCIIFVLSFFDLYSQAIYHKSRAVYDTIQDSLTVKTEQQRKQPFRNLPTIIENPLGLDGVKEDVINKYVI